MMLQATFFQRLGQSILMTIAIVVINHTLPDPVSAQEHPCQRSPQTALCQDPRSLAALGDRSTQAFQVTILKLNAAYKYEGGFNHAA
ncbi:MAG: hypothetical protein KME27_10330 [Lyngbya sp. HA4199-MV5]|nr:hypothetical protein [Lyngbya sp. HA4199-MV5]